MDYWNANAAARRMWARFEVYHSVTYFSPESTLATKALGCQGWTGYFGCRVAPLGAVTSEVAASILYHYYPGIVRRWITDAWQTAEPSAYLEARLTGVDRALRRTFGADVNGREIVKAAELAVAAAREIPTAGRPLSAANARLLITEPAHVALWQATTALRESRGEGHVSILVAADLAACEGLVLFAADPGNRIKPGNLMAARRWPPSEWSTATERLVERGLLDRKGALTAAGRVLRRWIETRTDAAASAPWLALGRQRTDQLIGLLTPLARRLNDTTDGLRPGNPIGLDVLTELAA
jgi:hypothetical protein